MLLTLKNRLGNLINLYVFIIIKLHYCINSLLKEFTYNYLVKSSICMLNFIHRYLVNI